MMMADKRRKPGALHIKRFTEGKSNEISFSVLDARNNEPKNVGKRDKKGGRTRFTGVFRPAPLSGVRPLWQSGSSGAKKNTKTRESDDQRTKEFSDSQLSNGVKIVSRETPFHRAAEQEIARRKAKRRNRRLISGLFGTVLLVVALGAGGLYVHGLYKTEVESRAVLSDAIESIEATDDFILEVDSLIGKKIDETSLARLQELDKEIPAVKTQLSEARKHAESALDTLRGSKDKEAAGQAMNSVDSRTEMLVQADMVISLMADTYADVRAIEEAWGSLLTADALAREAVSLVSETTEENVNASIEKTQAARQEFEEAWNEFNSLVGIEGLDVQPYLDYIDKRVESLDYASLSNEAILIQDKSTAEEYNEKYNQADIQAAKLAEGFENSPSNSIYARYDQETERLFSNYGNARASAGTADSFLRDYLGTSGK